MSAVCVEFSGVWHHDGTVLRPNQATCSENAVVPGMRA
jgi:hypothetical protein